MALYCKSSWAILRGLGKINSDTENALHTTCHSSKVKISNIQGELASSFLDHFIGMSLRLGGAV